MSKLTLERVAAALRAQGLDEHVGAVLDALTKKPPQTANAARQARFRERRGVTKERYITPLHNAPPTEPSVTKERYITPKVTPLARVEDSSTKQVDTGKKVKNSTPSGVTPRDALLECLTPEIADAVLAHRQAIRKPLSGHAAQLLAKGFLATGQPNAAADLMIARGWQGFDPEWFVNKNNSRGAGNGRRPITGPEGVADRRIREFDAMYDANPDRGQVRQDAPVLISPRRRE
jgi:hypothetical protein